MVFVDDFVVCVFFSKDRIFGGGGAEVVSLFFLRILVGFWVAFRKASQLLL